ncbi:hypothetical protein AAFP30_27695 [Gordonia sp. CPCC 205515]|uniref:hypothetical protein n=1 Tax=Gordonia sp. CPCC 205515 TaxID=3140791 RepID=UPI003AF39DC8
MGAALTVALAAQAAPAGAEPSPQIPQGDTSPQTPQGDTSPQTPETPAPAPAPSAPSYVPEQRVVPISPPSTDYWQPVPEPQYSTPYDPTYAPPRTAPRPAPRVPRIAPEPETLRVGNLVVDEADIPDVPNKTALIGSGNEWSAWAEQEIANLLLSMGVPRDEATRKAAAAVIGAVAGGALGGTVAATATALVVGSVAIPLATIIGTGIGAGVGAALPAPAPGINAGPGALIGAGAGFATGAAITAFSAAAAGAGGAALGAAIGGGLAYALGAGDPGTSRERPGLPLTQEPTDPTPPPNPTPPPPDPGTDQFRLDLPADQAADLGLPGTDVSYQVTGGGDVQVSGHAGGQQITAGWTAEQAQAPLRALGPAGAQAQKAITDTTRAVTDEVAKHLPGVTVEWPQQR